APLAALGVALALLGVLGLSMTGFAGLLTGHSALLIAVPVTAPGAVALILTGWLLVDRPTARRSR
ncbi:acyltransferase, partial [Streptomyces sp. NPDC057674]